MVTYRAVRKPEIMVHTMRYVMLEFTDDTWLPPPDIEYKLAYRLLAQDPPLDRLILEEVLGHQTRYRDLRRLLGGRNDNVLTKALARMCDEGLIHPGLDLDTKEKTYGVMELGKLVVFRLHEMVPHATSIEAYERGRAAA